jgi:hypothetical protein
MRRVGWHLDDVPQPFLTIRTIAFLILMSVVAGALMDGLLLGYDGTHHRSLVARLVISAVLAAVGALAGGVFGWTNTKSPRWRQWRKTMPTLTPGLPPGSRD